MLEPRKPRVLMLLENSSYPFDWRVYSEAQALTEGGCEVLVIAPGKPGQPWHEIDQEVRVYRYPRPRAGDGVWGYLWEYGYSLTAALVLSLYVFVRHGFDVLHAHNPPDMFVFLAALYKLFGKKFVFDHHDLSPEMYCVRFRDGGNRFVHYVLVWLEKFSCRLADQVIVTNESYKEMDRTRSKVPESRITIVRNGPDLDKFTQALPDEDLRKKAGTIIGYVGVMGNQDGIDYLLRACRHLIDDCGRTDFFCVLIGNGDAYKDLLALTKELNLEDHVWFTGLLAREEVARHLAATDICASPDPLNPYTDRSTTIKLMEYMALEKPTVAFDLTENRLTAQDAAIYACPNDELDFARKIEMLMDDTQRRTQMGRAGRERVVHELAWPYQVQNLLHVYHQLGFLPCPKTVEPQSPHGYEHVPS